MAARKVDVASIKSDYEAFKQEQAKALNETITDLKAQRTELDRQIAHLESVAGELNGKTAPAAPAAKSGRR
jgi:cell division septum initiation protein DivIVA